MNNQISIDKMDRFGLKPEDLGEVKFQHDQQLIDYITQSGMLYRRSVRHIVLKRIREFFNDQSIQPHEQLEIYFPRKKRKKLWNEFRDYLDLESPGLKLSRIAQFLCFLTVIGFLYLNWSLFTGGIGLLIAWQLTGLSLFPFLALLFIPLGFFMTSGISRLPALTVDDLMDQIVSINNIELLTNDKKALKSLLKKELHNSSIQHNL